MKTSIIALYLDPPAKVTLTGPSEIRPESGSEVVRCTSDSSNPPTELTFKIGSSDNHQVFLFILNTKIL